MKFRKLEQWEHGRTKVLYETVFSEDKGPFADYYYTWKTKDNTIYAAEDVSGIHAMVHLNPFEVSVYGKVQVLHYIVAVATEEAYRHRGLMRNLLNLSMKEMAENGEPFTFLMPASEAIYLPFGFRFVSWQRQGILRARPERNPNCQNREEWQKAGCGTFRAEREPEEKMYQTECGMIREMPETEESALRTGQQTKTICKECRPVRPGEYQALADMVNETLEEQTDIFIWRNYAYYERLVQEQRCQGGDVMAVLANGKIIGTFCTARGESGNSDRADCSKGEVCAAERGNGNDYVEERCVAERHSGNNYVEDRCAKEELSKNICENEDTSELAVQEENYAFELREIIAMKEFQDLVFTALQSFADENGDCKVYGYPDSLPLAQEERVPLMMARKLSRGERNLQKEYAPFAMAGRPSRGEQNSQEEHVPFMTGEQPSRDGAESGKANAFLPVSGTSVAPEGSEGKERAPLKAAELPEAVIFINEVV